MNKKKGFTLIELLAVIVILAVIALIATPIIMNIINDAKKGAAKDAGYMIIKAGEFAIADTQLESESLAHHYDEKSNLALKGEKPSKFNLNFNEKGESKLNAWINGYCVVKGYNEEEVTIDESKKTEETCVTESIVSNIETPVIKDGMIPVMFDGNGKTVKADTNSNWYDYDNKVWANAVAVTSGTRDKYKTANAGTEITETDILAYYVWIPRYRYQLWNVEGNESEPQEIKIEFENKNTTKSNGTQNGEWLTHPAFTFGDKELSGIWVGKFEMTGTKEAPTIKPNVYSLTNLNISTFFNIIKNMGSTYGLSSYDSHMMKNSEWGAVAYLSHSKYGKNGEVWINNVNTGTGVENNGVQWGPSITGCSGASASAGVQNNMTACASGYDYKQKGVNASTTGNITGIYDMAGGAWERVMANSVTEDGSFNSSSSGFTSAPESKYYDQYDYNTDVTNHSISKLGDAMKEVYATSTPRHWYNDYVNMPNSALPWVFRGGGYYDGSRAGVFYSDNSSGNAYSTYSARGVVVSS